MRFGIEKCVMLIMKSGKKETTEGRNRVAKSGKYQSLGEKEQYKNLGKSKADIIRNEKKKKKRREPQMDQKTSGDKTLLQ